MGSIRTYPDPAMLPAAGTRIHLAIAVGLASIAAIAAIVAVSPAGAGSVALDPDLVTMPIEASDLGMERKGGRSLLRFSNEVGNRGAGPLEINPSEVSADCDGDGDPVNDRDAFQRIYADADADGLYDPPEPVERERIFGCMRYHPAHDHWHVLDFAHYELRREPSGKLALRARKVGFCVVDNRLAFPGEGAATGPFYPTGPAEQTAQRGCQEAETQGLSPGWADIYLLGLPGQSLDVSALRRGRYCLASIVDPRNLLEERDEDNNATSVRLALRPRLLSARITRRPCSEAATRALARSP